MTILHCSLLVLVPGSSLCRDVGFTDQLGSPQLAALYTAGRTPGIASRQFHPGAEVRLLMRRHDFLPVLLSS
eukprot:179785-Amphidinium_carterae.2